MHRDIKPTNVLLNESARQLKLCDFGCAKQITDINESHLAYMCSRYYRAPELILGLEQYDHTVDLWSAGCVMAEMIIARYSNTHWAVTFEKIHFPKFWNSQIFLLLFTHSASCEYRESKKSLFTVSRTMV